MLTLLVGTLALCVDRAYNGDVYLQLLTGRFISHHGLVSHDPFPTIAHGQSWLNQQWLSELIFYRVNSVTGLTGLTLLYAALIAVPLALLLWCCRRKGAVMLVLASVLYFPGLLAVIHPRAAGFSVLAFSFLVVLVWSACRATTRDSGATWRPSWSLVAIVALFAVWANLHGGFVAGLLLIAAVTAGQTIDRRRRVPEAPAARQIAMLALTGVLAAGAATVMTPLGGEIWTYILSFRNPAIALGTQEWAPGFRSHPALLYLAITLAVSAWLWLRAPAPRPIAPLLVTAVFVVFTWFSLRNIVFVGPAIALQIAWSTPNRSTTGSRVPIALAGSAAIAVAMVWAIVLGPARNPTSLRSPAVAYALAHPPRDSRIAAYAGVSSYILWRAPQTPVVINGWLEHFSEAQLADNYGILRGWNGDPTERVKHLRVGGVIAHLPVGIRALKAHGFVVVFSGRGETYLVRRDMAPRGQTSPRTPAPSARCLRTPGTAGC